MAVAAAVAIHWGRIAREAALGEPSRWEGDLADGERLALEEVHIHVHVHVQAGLGGGPYTCACTGWPWRRSIYMHVYRLALEEVPSACMHTCVHTCMHTCVSTAHAAVQGASKKDTYMHMRTHMQVYRTRSSTRGFKKDVRQADIHARARGVGACVDGDAAVKELDAEHASVGGA